MNTIFLFIVIIALFIYVVRLFKCFNFNIEEFNNYVNSIPKIVHQIYIQGYDEIPNCAKDVINKNKLNNPDYKFKLYDLNDIESYLNENTSEYIINAYKLINPECKACIADFFRYIVIYNEGGIYADIKIRFKTNLDDWIHKSNKIKLSLWPWTNHIYLKKFYPKEFEIKSKNREINQSVLIFPPKHDILKSLIDEMVTIIYKEHDNPSKNQNILDITGPHLYTKVIAPMLNNNEFELADDEDYLFNGNVIYDGTKGCYHEALKEKNLKWTQMKDKIIL